MMNSLDYAELAGLNIALKNLECIDVTYKDEEWVAVTEWMKQRISHLTKLSKK